MRGQMVLIKNLAVVGLVGALAWAMPAVASLQPDAGGVTPDPTTIVSTPEARGTDTAICLGLECRLLQQQSAVKAVAIASGAPAPATTLDRPSLFPEPRSATSAGKFLASLSNGDERSAGPSSDRDAAPLLFTMIGPASVATQFCIDDGGLLGHSTCKPIVDRPRHCEIFTDGQSPACRPDAPEPGTVLLLGIGLLGLAAVRTRRRS